MKQHYFDQDCPDSDDVQLQMAAIQGYVPSTCLLGGAVVLGLVKAGEDPCGTCKGPREKCHGRPIRRVQVADAVSNIRAERQYTPPKAGACKWCGTETTNRVGHVAPGLKTVYACPPCADTHKLVPSAWRALRLKAEIPLTAAASASKIPFARLALIEGSAVEPTESERLVLAELYGDDPNKVEEPGGR